MTLKKYDVINHRYIIDCIIGQGSFGLTYFALDKLERTYVVVKECAPYGKSCREMQLELFRNEASILRVLSDLPEVVSFKDLFSANNTCYIVMDYIDGITLKEWVEASGKRSFDECVTLFRPVINCMRVIHKRGIIHRDICPENIMYTSESKLAIIDFGSAINLNWKNSRNIWLSTYRKGFSPLEQYGTEYDFGTWSDVYSVCAVIYYCMTKLVPVNAVDRKPSHDDWEQEVTKKRLKEIVENGMALQVRDRWKTVDDILKVLTETKTD